MCNNGNIAEVFSSYVETKINELLQKGWVLLNSHSDGVHDTVYVLGKPRPVRSFTIADKPIYLTEWGLRFTAPTTTPTPTPTPTPPTPTLTVPVSPLTQMTKYLTSQNIEVINRVVTRLDIEEIFLTGDVGRMRNIQNLRPGWRFLLACIDKDGDILYVAGRAG